MGAEITIGIDINCNVFCNITITSNEYPALFSRVLLHEGRRGRPDKPYERRAPVSAQLF